MLLIQEWEELERDDISVGLRSDTAAETGALISIIADEEQQLRNLPTFGMF